MEHEQDQRPQRERPEPEASALADAPEFEVTVPEAGQNPAQGYDPWGDE